MNRNPRDRYHLSRWLLIAVLITMGCRPSTDEAGSTDFAVYSDPGQDAWEPVSTSDVAELCGLNPQILQAVDDSVDFPYAIVRRGLLCHEFYPGESTAEDVAENFSATKTLSAVALGRLARMSRTLPVPFSDTDRMDQWIEPDPNDLNPIDPDAQVAHVLAQVARTDPEFGNDIMEGNRLWLYDAAGNQQLNRLVDVMNAVIAQDPSQFSGLEEEAQPNFAKTFVETELFAKLGMRDSVIDFFGSGLFLVAAGWQSTVRDFARLGLFLARDGVWDGERLVDSSWIESIRHAVFEDSNTGYGYLTYVASQYGFKVPGFSNFFDFPFSTCQPPALWPEYPHGLSESLDCGYDEVYSCRQQYDVGVFGAAGSGGQIIAVHPGLDLVIVTRNAGDGDFLHGMWNRIRPALVAEDPVYAGDEQAFCTAYSAGLYAPDWIGLE